MEVLGPEAGAEAGAARHHHPREEAGSQEEAAQDQLRLRLAAEAGPAETPTQAPGPHPIPSSNTGHPPPPSQDHHPLHLLGEAETASEVSVNVQIAKGCVMSRATNLDNSKYQKVVKIYNRSKHTFIYYS
mgnify:CR=1 FL=1